MRDRHWLGLALLALGPWGAGASCRAGQVVDVVNRGGCVFNSGDTCFSTPNYPTGLYDSNEHCEVEVCSGVTYTLSGFSVEAGEWRESLTIFLSCIINNFFFFCITYNFFFILYQRVVLK